MDTLYNMPAHPFKSDPTEISKPGNKFYAFFRPRSRSRSRSKSVVTPSTPQPMLSRVEAISVTQTHSLSSRLPRLSTEHIPSTDNPPSSYISSPTKSIARSQSRPISSTTTATHSTIAPLPSDALRKRVNGRHEYVPRPESADDTHESHQSHDQRSDSYEHDGQHRPPRSETPSSTKRKLGLHTFFGIALTRRSSSSSSPRRVSSIASEHKASTSTLVSEASRNVASRRRSFRLGSRPNTPRKIDTSSDRKGYTNSIPIPSNPLPLSASPRRRSFGLSSPHHTPKSSAGHLPLPVTHGGQSHGRRHSVGSHQTAHDSAVALPEDQVNLSKSKRPPLDFKQNKGKEKQQSGNSEQSHQKVHPSAVHSMTASISQSPSANPSVISRRHLSSPTPGNGLDTSVGTRPHIQHLPTVESMSSDEAEGPLPLFAPRPVHVIPKIIHTPPTPQRAGDLDSPLRPNTSPPRVDSTKVKISQGRAKAAPREHLLVSTSHCHTDSITSTSSKSPSELSPEPTASRSRFTPRLFRGKDLPKPKEPGLGTRGGLPNSNVPPRHISNHRVKLGSFDFERPVSRLNRSSSTINRSQHRLPLEHTVSSDSTRGGRSRLAAYQTAYMDTPVHPHITPNHTGETSVVSFSSSIPSKSTEKGGSSNPGQSSSWGRSSGKRIQRTSHGAFTFEHPASLPNSPMPNSSNLPHSAPVGSSQSDRSGRGLLASTNSPWSPSFDLRLKRSRDRHEPSEDVDTSVVKQDRKTKGKGRSLDLGLGLAWAPSHVREEAVMPGLFVVKENIKANGRSYGFDVTKVFEEILSAADFEAFKKYVHRYDAHIISLDGPSGLLSRVDKLLVNSRIGEHERNSLMTEFACFVENHSE
ncbi:hypothetical protein V8B97DRAFT_57570 [Scleroderma yunnanense]